MPPPYTASRWPHSPGRLGGLERRVRAWPLLRALGDHFLVVLRRTGSGIPA